MYIQDRILKNARFVARTNDDSSFANWTNEQTFQRSEATAPTSSFSNPGYTNILAVHTIDNNMSLCALWVHCMCS